MTENTVSHFASFDESRHMVSQAGTGTAAAKTDISKPQSEGDFSFWDFLDMINPLQHLPIVNMVYRELTGDTIKPASRIVGGTLFGGIGGAVSAVANAIIEDTSGKDIGGHIMTAFRDEETAPEEQTPGKTPEQTQEQPPVRIASLDSRAEETNQLYPDEQVPDLSLAQMHPVVQIYAKNYVDHRGNVLTLEETRQTPQKTEPKIGPNSRLSPETTFNLALNTPSDDAGTRYAGPSYTERVLNQYN